MRLSPLVKTLKPSPTLAVNALAQQLRAEGKQIIDLSVGEPDFDTPTAICEAAKLALDQGKTKYTPVPGIPALRDAICRYLQKRIGISYAREHIVVSTGAKQAIYNAILALISPGDEVILPCPYWVSYPTQIELAGGTPIYVQTRLEDDFQLDVDAIAQAITPYTKLLIINSPNNPTGAVYSRERVVALAELLKQHPQIWILSDEIYEQLVYDDAKATSILEIDPLLQQRTILINGFSKSHAMTGWRVGYLAAPAALAKATIALQGASTSGTNTAAQYAALRALADDLEPEIANMREIFAHRRDIMLSAFAELPKVRCPKPQGAFYLMADFSAWLPSYTAQGVLLTNTVQLSTYLLEQAQVASVDGEGFGAEGFLRFSYAADEQTIILAAQQIRRALELLSNTAKEHDIK
jgi:aspartate aminotransferase